MKDNLIRDIELKLSASCPEIDREKVLRCVIACLDDYDVTARETGLTVRYEDINEKILKRYVACSRIDGKSEKTVRQYIWICNRLSTFLKKPYTDMSANDIRYFLAEQKAQGIQSVTVENYRAFISAFFHWMTVEEIIPKNPTVKVKPIKCEIKEKLPYSSVEIDKIRSACDSLKRRAMVEVLLSSGVRCNELVGLDISDVDLRNRTILVRNGKGGKSRRTYISEVAAEYLGRYLSTRKDSDVELFRTQQCERYSCSGVQDMMRRLGKRAGITDVHPHRFRRTFATSLYRKGMDTHEIQKLMGHSKIQTTLTYIYTDDSQIRSAYERYAA